jgi:RNase P subunit RPR2
MENAFIKSINSKDINMKNNMKSNIKSTCNHNSNKLWFAVKTIRVKRDGFGNIKKTALMKCKNCGEIQEKTISFFDERVDFKW